MAQALDLADIQGNILRGYGKFGYPKARYFFFNIAPDKAAEGRAFVDAVRPKVTTSEFWDDSNPAPDATLNIAFSWYGLVALGLPTRTLRAMPAEFIDGMANRSTILGDKGESAPEHWDPLWQKGTPDNLHRAHIWVSINGRMDQEGKTPKLDELTQWLLGEADTNPAVSVLTGHGPGDAKYQEAMVLFAQGPDGKPVPTPKEHFGYTDGIGDPVFDRQLPPDEEALRVIGRGKLMPDQTWKPLATGEFVLGHEDESQEIPPSAPPIEFTRNGTYMVYRKLHENVKRFNDYVAEKTEQYAQMTGMEHEAAKETLLAKMVGRWTDGVPLMKAPTYEDWQAFRKDWADIGQIRAKKKSERTPEEQKRYNDYKREFIDFKYGNDLEGTRCPVSAHIRRANTRDMLDPLIASDDKSGLTGSALNKRRRILRRGLPYGSYDPAKGDDGEHGIIFMAVCASIVRQFEFVLQQWMNYGLDFNVGNDTCPVIGLHENRAKFVIASDPKSGHPPYICDDLPQFVTTRGGDYFFIPSISALRMIAMGTVDPT